MIDLHLHSTASDGALAPEEVVREAAAAGLSAIALTDHDTTAGVAAAARAGREIGLEVVPGVEISMRFENGSFHLLGLFVDSGAEALAGLLERIREGRRARNEAMARRLCEVGAPVSIEEVVRISGGGVVGRPHFARALCDAGHVRRPLQAFERLIGHGKVAYVDRWRPEFPEAAAAIHAAGGVAVLCHPHTLGLTEEQGGELETFVADRVAEGLDAMEVRYPEYGRHREGVFRGIAERQGILVSGGSDFHAPGVRGFVPGGGLRIPDEWLALLRERAGRYRPR